MDSPRHLVAIGLIAAMVMISGCSAAITGDKPLEYSASQPTVADSALEETGYELEGTKNATIERNVSVAGQSRTVILNNKLAAYSHDAPSGALEGKPTGLFVVAGVPQPSIAGVEVNVLQFVNEKMLIKQAGQQYSQIRDVEKVGERNMTVLGNTTTVSKYSALSQWQGQEVEITMHVATTTDGSDNVIAVGMYPTKLADMEQSRVFTLLKHIEH